MAQNHVPNHVLNQQQPQPRVLVDNGNGDVGTWDLDCPRNWHPGFEKRALPYSSNL